MQDNQEKANTSELENDPAPQTDAAAPVPTDSAPVNAEENLKHIYVEVSNDLLAKPNALIDLIQAAGNVPTVIFCNSPSEADFVDVMLKKNSIASQKLIGHVPTSRVTTALQQVRNAELTALVVTDVSAQELAVGCFHLLINYSIHDDPEVYLHRISPENGLGALRKVISIISPLDFGNFHYLKKILQYEFEAGSLPSKEDVCRSQAMKLVAEAADGPHLKDERVKVITNAILADAGRDSAVALLVYNTINVLPSLQTGAERTTDRERAPDAQDNRGDRRSYRGRGDNQGGDRQQRRGEDRGRDRERDREHNRDRDYDRDRDRDRDRDHDRGGWQRRMPPPKRDVRYYVGHGQQDGFSEEEFFAIAAEQCQVPAESIKRFSLRSKYSFVDIEEEAAEKSAQFFSDASRSDGVRLFIRKATFITGPREQDEEDGSTGEGLAESESFKANRSDDSAEDIADEHLDDAAAVNLEGNDLEDTDNR